MASNGRQNADDTLALALASGKTVRAAAKVAGLGERTASRRVAESAFRQRVNELRGEIVARALGHLADGMSEAAITLRQLLSAESESVRLSAARSILDLGIRLRDAVELEERIRGLESQLLEPDGR